MDKYRFDDSYGSVYICVGSAYLFLASYLQIGINASMSDSEKEQLANNYHPNMIDDDDHY